jgi:creatinine amidohydrolase/Fe(II)-dependent formamide hydrolase-like protein
MTSDPLAPLRVLDELEVGPVRVEPNRLTAPYTVTREGASQSTELVYRFEEDVFEPAATESQNLAAMVAAQVALNYGLFCRRIVLRGVFDEVDRRFLTEMASNTAREIYVKKLLQPNPFLVGEVAELPTVKRSDYLQAELQFDPDGPETTVGDASWSSSADRFAVLSSGGKDSLLSLGLLDEMGLEAHSIFVNESGRHWYTALNAYRDLQEASPATTSRVWTSSDRVFNWLLRHLPFIRPDFSRIRSDDYPLRLWTVAVFSFGALPVLRKRGLAHLVIGDEYDTTRRLRHQGIPHFDGLYDQSRYFDERLTRYYRRKGWPVLQYSLLRPLSELLIQRLLCERYPALHRNQVSCHATHLEGERVVPCGRCEKCRRIVAMHLALGADPSLCGYTEDQVTGSLGALGESGVHQESVAGQQLARMLLDRGLISGDSPFARAARERPEVLHLRFHDDAAPPEAIPARLRRPLYSILRQHARGALRRHGRSWLPVDLLDDALLSRPYPFEGRGDEVASRSPETARARSPYLLGELTWPLAAERFETTDTALLPVGAIEQHGPHLPLDTDAWDAEYLCAEVARRCSDPKPLVFPLIPYGVSYHHQDFPGTLTISPEALSRVVYEIGMSAARHGIVKLVIVNGHGGNGPTLKYAAQMINRDAHIFTCVDSGETSDADIAELTETPNDVHAGEVETSTTLATRPELVDMSRARKAVPRFSSEYLDFTSRRSIEWYAHTGKLSKSGVLGDPTKATREKGERYWELMFQHLVAFVEQIKGLSLAEIHDRRL